MLYITVLNLEHRLHWHIVLLKEAQSLRDLPCPSHLSSCCPRRLWVHLNSLGEPVLYRETLFA